ncbi:DUF6538 domain-containing protein [Brevundimonas sp. DWR2-3-1b1]|uniref:DUF6538 domain-containing protein n=1 Tax=unclassified Brevundimonas TaxID=2622653 RepID=UPI003CF47F0E
MAETPTIEGLFQKVLGGVWYVRRAIPVALRPHFGGRVAFKASTKTRDHGRAMHLRNRFWAEWTDELNYAARLGSGRPMDLAEVESEIEFWRRMRCASAAGTDVEERHGGKPAPWPITSGAKGWGDWFFGAVYERAPADAVWRQPRERGAAMSHTTGLLLGGLQRAARLPDAWAEVDGLDDALDAVVAHLTTGDEPRLIPRAVRVAARQTFARAALEVVQHEEAERRRADAILTALDAVAADTALIRVVPSVQPFTPREGDKTIQQVLEAFKADQNSPALWQKQYGHISRALSEIIGADKPIRALTRLDVRDVRRFLETVPTHVSKKGIFKGRSMIWAAERAALDGLPTLAPNTVRSYLVALKGICDFAADPVRAWLDENPVEKEVPPKKAMTRRHGLTSEQLALAFDALADEREADSGNFWVPAVLAFMGARANEIAQLHISDVRQEKGVAFLDLDHFDADGRRLDRRQLKTEASARCIPIHKALIDAGFNDLVARRREAGEERLFPDLKANSLGYYTHEVSRRWGRTLDRVGLTMPALTLHSLRHGWKDAAAQARLPGTLIAALGGWTGRAVGEADSAMHGYGRATIANVPGNSVLMDQVRLGNFVLPTA